MRTIVDIARLHLDGLITQKTIAITGDGFMVSSIRMKHLRRTAEPSVNLNRIRSWATPATAVRVDAAKALAYPNLLYGERLKASRRTNGYFLIRGLSSRIILATSTNGCRREHM
jgi:hypothetical protein